MPKIKIEIAVSDDITEQVVEAIQASASTGKIGDGKIFVLDLGEAIRIRTNETGTEAL
jgi:nitrogen regulatory protein P-II 2